MAKYGMAIDIDNCIACGACAIACKTENNTQEEDLVNGRKYNWADFLTFTKDTFPATRFETLPVLCNHCTDAPCVTGCPVSPTAMYKSAEGVTLHNDSRCIGCQLCITNCPYSNQNTITDEVQYSVLSYNPSTPNPHSFWEDGNAIMAGTSTPAEIATAAGFTPPYKNDYTHADYGAVRPSNVTEKCMFCDHRVQNGDDPYCVVSCPTGARVFGDLDDPTSDISNAIAVGSDRLADNYGNFLGANTGTNPNVYYLGDVSTDTAEIVTPKENEKLTIFPNPARTETKAKYRLNEDSNITLSIYDITGKVVKKVISNEYRLKGTYTNSINVSDLRNGTYICRLQAGDRVLTSNIIVTK